MSVECKLSDDEKNGLLNNGVNFVLKAERLCEVGDTFYIDQNKFEVVDVRSQMFYEVAGLYYRCFGFDSPVSFIEDWTAKHGPINSTYAKMNMYMIKKSDN